MRYCGYILILMVFFHIAAAQAAENGNSEVEKISSSDHPVPPVRGESLVSMAGHKFVRGLTNAATGTGEIPRQMIISYRNDGPALFVPFGFFTGLFMTVARTCYGAVEAATFLAPIEGTYDSLLEPAYVWGPIK